jgi:hypothetical protein
MDKLTYLKLAITNKLFYEREWILTAFAVTKPSEEHIKSPYIGRIVSQTWGYGFINAEQQIENILEAPIAAPLFSFKDTITIDSSWCENIQTPTLTTVGNLLFNCICMLPSFGAKHPFLLGRVSIGDIENKIAPLLNDTPVKDRDPSKYYVDEYVRFVDTLQFISSLSNITCYAATPKSIVSPTGIKEFKAALLIKYKGMLHDPVVLSKFEAELLAFDDAFLKDDPAYGKFLSGKVKNVARKKMFLSLGAEKGFTNSLTVVPVLNSLEEGWSSDPVQYTAMMNGLRIGSYSRGSETAKGGMSAKLLLRATNEYIIKDTDCGSKLGIRRLFTQTNALKLVGRYVIVQNVPKLIESLTDTTNYLNKHIIVRSPMYCSLTGSVICRVCAGENLFKFPQGLTIPLTEISSIILSTSLAAMHGTVLSTARLDINRNFS